MSTSKKVILRPTKSNPKLGILRLQTITNRKSKEKSLKIKIQVKHWNADKQFVYSTEPNADKINKKIQEVLTNEKGNLIQKVKEGSLIEFAENHLSLIQKKSTRNVKMFTLNKLKEFLKSEGNSDLLFPEVDLYFIKRFYNYLQDTCKLSTANEYMTNFKYFINQADFHDKYTYTKDPFKNFKKQSLKNTHEVMTPSEVEAFFNYVPQDESFLHVQYGFGFMMHAAGMRISDLLSMRWGNFKKVGEAYHVEYTTQKNNKPMNPKLTVEALQYLIPFMEEYGVSLREYRAIEKKTTPLYQDIKNMIKEESELVIQDLDNMTIDMSDDDNKSFTEEFQEKAHEIYKKNVRKIYLQQQVEKRKKEIESNKLVMMKLLAEQVLKIKKNYADETVLPHCRGVAKEDFRRVQDAVKQQFNYRLDRIQKELGIETNISNHQARHVFAQRLFEAGVNFHNISMALGHKTLETTENYRKQLMTEDAMDVVEEFSKLRQSS